MNKEVTHRQYYGQFVTPSIKDMVVRRVTIDRIKSSTDENFNDIPLQEWDWLTDYLSNCYPDGNNCLASKVCILKEAAKQIKESQ
jgi:hypothetical protein